MLKYEDFKLNTIETIDYESIKKLLNKHIVFDWYDDGTNVFTKVPGKILDYNDKEVIIYTNDIIMQDDSDNSNNMIYHIKYENIKNVYEFDKYNDNYLELYDFINLDEDSKFIITNIYGKKLEVIIDDVDSLNIYFSFNNGREIINTSYPVYLLEKVEKK